MPLRLHAAYEGLSRGNLIQQVTAGAKVYYDELRNSVDTPAFVYDENRLMDMAALVTQVKEQTGCRVLYAFKAQNLVSMCRLFTSVLDGISVSSSFEAKLARLAFPTLSLHYTSPGLRPRDIDELASICDFITVNSFGHLERYNEAFEGRVSLGLRIDTGLSYVLDEKYDPCRPDSKLGVPVESIHHDLANLARVKGIHIHTNCESSDLAQLKANVDVLLNTLPSTLQIDWVNLGGGYLLDELESFEILAECVHAIRERFQAEVFIEPGTALVNSAGYLVSEVVDLIDSKQRMIAVLDTSVNHLPEVLEFGYQPEVIGSSEGGPHEYILAGASCLAGDIFGKYGFDEPLEVGARVVFRDVGAYSLVKTHRFNGINFPNVYSLKKNGEIELIKSWSFEDYAREWMPNE